MRYLNPEEITQIHFWPLVILSLVLLFLYLFFGILRPIKLITQIPAVLFFNALEKTISVPVEIHHPNSNHSTKSHLGNLNIPFPIFSRIIFDQYFQDGDSEDINISDPFTLQGVLASLIQYVFVDLYAKEHMGTWGRHDRFMTGPFQAGFAVDIPGQKFLKSELAQKSKNVFLKKLADDVPIILPHKTSVYFPSSQEVVFSSILYRLRISILCHSGMNMSTWKYALGTTSTWYRKLDSEYDNIYAFLFSIQLDFKIKFGFWRIFAEEWVPTSIRPKVTLRDICSWVNRIIEIVEAYFDWVDEDVFSLPSNEVSVLDDKRTLTYKSLSLGNPRIRFKP